MGDEPVMEDGAISFPEEIPRDSYELIDLLNELLPERCILQDEPITYAHRYAGARDLINTLVDWKAEELADQGLH